MVPRGSAEWAPSCSPRLLCGVTLLVVLITRAMSVTPGLQLEARSTNTSSQEECVPVHWDSYQHSSWNPSLDDLIPEYTIWQQFYIKNSTANFTVTFNPAKWSRQPYKLSYSEGRYHYNKTLPPYVTEDGRVCVNASITMYDLQGEIDYGDYTINVSTDCSSSNMTFQLEIDKCGIKDIPRPIHPTLEPLIVPEGNGQRALSWKYDFFGDNKLTDYPFHITKFGETVCDESSRGYHDHFNCSRETLGQCHVTITAHIQNYTHKDTGEYCAAAYPAGGPSPGNDSCLKLVVVQQPVVVEPFPGKSKLGLFKGASLVYHISNFSEYVSIKFKKGRNKLIDPSGDGYKLELQYDPLDNTTVTMTLHMTGNLKHAGDYTLCMSIANDTSTLHCITSVSVSEGLWIGGVVGIFCTFLLVICCCCSICFCKKCNPFTRFNKSKLNKRTPELKKQDAGDDDDDLEKDSVGTPNVALFYTIINFLRVCISCCRHEQQRSTNGYVRLKEESNPTEGESDSTEDDIPGSRPGSSASGAAESPQHQAVEVEVHEGVTEAKPLLASATAPGGYNSICTQSKSIRDTGAGAATETKPVLLSATVLGGYNTTKSGTDLKSPEDDEKDSPCPHQLKTSTSTCTDAPPVWKQIPDASLDLCLDGRQLQKTSELLTEWKPLARYLGLEEPTVAEIYEDNKSSFKEQKHQMLHKWSQRKGDDATLKTLLQCVEFELGDRELAQKIFNTLN